MTGPYRESDNAAIDCPRCNRAMPPGAIAACTRGCGVWVNAETARDALLPNERAPSRLTTWFRECVPCPHCSTQMTLCGYDMSLLQGCEEHGYWIDEETVSQTGLARPLVAPQVQRARDAAKALRLEQDRRDKEDRASRLAEERSRRESSAEALAALAAQKERERREAADRVARLRPYVQLLAPMFARGDFLPLAEHLMTLHETVETLKRRIANLERGG